MADFFDRDRHEQATAQGLRHFFRVQQAEWERRLREVKNDPDRIGKRFLTDQQAALTAYLLLLNRNPVKSAMNLELRKAADAIDRAGLDPDKIRSRVENAAYRQSLSASDRMARQIVAGTAFKLRADRDAVRSDREARKERIKDLFGSVRVEGISITATTGAKSLGIRTASEILEDEEIRVFTIWVTERDGKECPICRGFDGKGPAVWGGQFPDGPPAHPRCRCDLETTYR